MALIHASATVLGLCFFLIAELCLGALLLRKLGLVIEPFAEFSLIAAATGVVLSEIAIFLLQWTQHIRIGCFTLVLLSLLPIRMELSKLWLEAKRAYQASPSLERREKAALYGIGAVLLIELLASLAPMTGSDALHYHFTTQKLVLETGFHPIFFLTHSFLCGQSHLLILLGLALGNEQIATGLLFLGGALLALSVFCLAVRWITRLLALVFTAAFLVTPLVFWQLSASGSPDMWMGVFVCSATLLVSNNRVEISWRHAVLAGFLAGGVAGAKFTGCTFAATLLLALYVETRSFLKAALFSIAALFSGIWPYLRNFLWTGDPVFPFLTRTLFPERLNAFGLASLHADTGVTSSHHVRGIFSFLLFAGQQGSTPAFWEFYGPIVLSFLPLLVPAITNTREWRVRLYVWIASGVLIFSASGLNRFMFPLFPIALSCAAAGVFHAAQRGWLQAYRVAVASAVLFIFIGGAGLVAYSGPALLAAAGIHDSKTYLETRAPDYKTVAAIDRSLGTERSAGKALVFFRHLYYLRSPYVLGNPDGSWSVNPDLLKTPGDFRAFFQREGIAYVVRAPEYPDVIAGPLRQMEKDGSLVPYSEALVDNFSGNRIAGQRKEVRVLIFRVNSAAPGSPAPATP